jgi:hypothetical protein
MGTTAASVIICLGKSDIWGTRTRTTHVNFNYSTHMFSFLDFLRF